MTAGRNAAPPPAANEPIISVSGLVKRFAQITAVDGISFQVNRGEIFGLLGPNGAGKTTTINILTGLARPDSGTVRIAGLDCSRDPKAAQHLIGVVPDESNLYPELSGFENLCFCAALYGMRKEERRTGARGLLEAFDLAGAAGRKVAGYSRGMRRKLTIAAGLIHRPSILFLDEPTTGIDVASARRIRGRIRDLRRDGTTVFLTTHYIEEAERLCDRIAFLVGGRIVLEDSVPRLLQPLQNKHLLVLTVPGADGALCARLAEAFPEYGVTADGDGGVRIEAAAAIPLAPLVDYLAERGLDVTEARRLHPSLEEVFVRVTGLQAESMRKEKEKGGGGGE
ncbi:MAG: ABC transporter ATP-binding protein [Anaerolineales bacterium]|nr:ABC transporter ATP-binding protein [Anaerolineales bacterium]